LAQVSGIMDNPVTYETYPQLTTPRAAAVAGILFSLLFAASLVLLRISIPEDLTGGTEWIAQASGRLPIALALMPFAGVSFLWFIGVIRDRLGELEDRFVATVFFGSSLLFIGMVFVAMAIAGALVASASLTPSEAIHRDIVLFGRALMFQISNVYALRMAAVLMMSLGTMWFRTHAMPRWLVIVTYVVAGVLLLVVSLSLWVTLLFPAWVLLVSVYVLFLGNRRQEPKDIRGEE